MKGLNAECEARWKIALSELRSLWKMVICQTNKKKKEKKKPNYTSLSKKQFPKIHIGLIWSGKFQKKHQRCFILAWHE